jgi:hypothetical protein
MSVKVPQHGNTPFVNAPEIVVGLKDTIWSAGQAARQSFMHDALLNRDVMGMPEGNRFIITPAD